MKQLIQFVYHSPIGDIDILEGDGKLLYLDFSDNPDRMEKLLTTRYRHFSITRNQERSSVHELLDQYFAGKNPNMRKVSLQTDGTEFQQQVWNSLCNIPYGETLDYSALASQVGNPQAVRAAASSNARNPISIIIPCHRVIGKDGSLRGYAGGEHRKKWLLEHEGAL